MDGRLLLYSGIVTFQIEENIKTLPNVLFSKFSMSVLLSIVSSAKFDSLTVDTIKMGSEYCKS